MKRVGAIILTLLVVTITLGGVNRRVCNAKGAETVPDCVVSNRSNGEYWVTIIANREKIEDETEFAEELIEQMRNDGFQRIKFFWGDGSEYPTSLQMSVYLTEADWQNKHKEPYMKILFRQENIVNGYNILEDYDRFKLEMK